MTDNAAAVVQLVQQGKQITDFLHRIGGAGLLAVAESGICYVDLLRKVHGDNPVIENEFGDIVVWVHVPEQIGFLYIGEVEAQFQKTRLFIELRYHTCHCVSSFIYRCPFIEAGSPVYSFTL